jgi:hypothetical protein
MLPLLLLAATATATPPAATLDQLEAALERLADPAQVQRFEVTTIARHADTDGDDAHVDVVVAGICFDASGEQTNTVISHTRDGAPFEPEDDKADKDGEKKEAGVSWTLPAGDDLPRYVYGATTMQGSAAVASFQPAPGQSKVEDLATGQLAWDPTDLRPLWISFEPVEKPFLVKSVNMRLVIGETDDKLHTTRILSSGVGGPPLMRKRFEMDMRFHDVVWR